MCPCRVKQAGLTSLMQLGEASVAHFQSSMFVSSRCTLTSHSAYTIHRFASRIPTIRTMEALSIATSLARAALFPYCQLAPGLSRKVGPSSSSMPHVYLSTNPDALFPPQHRSQDRRSTIGVRVSRPVQRGRKCRSTNRGS